MNMCLNEGAGYSTNTMCVCVYTIKLANEFGAAANCHAPLVQDQVPGAAHELWASADKLLESGQALPGGTSPFYSWVCL